MKRAECFKATYDDWYPGFKIKNDKRYEGDFVSLSLIPLSNGLYRVCVWGADDTGMEYDTADPSEAKEIYLNLCLENSISKSHLEILGFVGA